MKKFLQVNCKSIKRLNDGKIYAELQPGFGMSDVLRHRELCKRNELPCIIIHKLKGKCMLSVNFNTVLLKSRRLLHDIQYVLFRFWEWVKRKFRKSRTSGFIESNNSGKVYFELSVKNAEMLATRLFDDLAEVVGW